LNSINTTNGYININKSIDWTSNDVVRKLKGLLGVKKIGHGGTLDPLATGVLPICLNSATRFSEYILHGSKSYLASIKLGESTDTYDSHGKVINTKDYSFITKKHIQDTLCELKNIQSQIAPMYSALKHNGVPLYKLAREGKTVKRKIREIKIYKIELINYNLPFLTLRLDCSHGFYVRSFANDLGEKLGSLAHLVSLERTRAGVFELKNSIKIDDIDQYVKNGDINNYIMPVDYTLKHLKNFSCDISQEKMARTGQKISLSSINKPIIYDDKEDIVAYSEQNTLIGLLTFSKKDLELKAKKIINN
tara:strand:- start:8458 stop:9375 length:918 start_codon:yes stop_codon:yes gene_type:complete